MQSLIRSCGLWPAILLLVACATPRTALHYAEPFCQVGGWSFYTDFETAALHSCAADRNGVPVLTVAPEYAPINPSPWYAWRISAGSDRSGAEGPVTVRQRYLHGWHRYQPWVSIDGENWQRLPEERVSVLDGGSVEFTLHIPAGDLFVAAQPPLTHTDMQDWAKGLAGDHGLTLQTVARSVDGMPVTAYHSEFGRRQGLVVLISRQHPPEVTGGLAYQDFVERLFMDDDLAQRFRARYALGLVPEINPDGVIRGHWRTNRRGVDLNRDWGPFTQPETSGVANWMARLQQQAPLQLFMDFHSTSYDVFYMPHATDDPFPPGFAATWRANLGSRLGDEMPAWSGDHNPGLPTAKSWVRKQYGVVAMTYEVGDRTPRDRIRRIAEAAAEEMMILMLEIEDKLQ